MGSSWGTLSTTFSSDGKETLRISSTWRGTPSTVTLFLDSTSVTVSYPQWVECRASGSFTHTSSQLWFFACLCSTHSVMAHGCYYLYVKTDWYGTDASSWPVFGAMLYQKTASCGENWLFSASAFMVWWCLSMIPLLLGWYADLKYRLTPHFSHICLKTSTGPFFRNTSTTLSLSLSLFWFLRHITTLPGPQSIIDRYSSWQ